jgi:hypothetical protein
MTENLIGWTGYEWSIPRPCQRCKKAITRGIIKVSDRGRETAVDFKTVCWPCFYELPKTAEEAEQNGI